MAYDGLPTKFFKYRERERDRDRERERERERGYNSDIVETVIVII